MQTKFIEVTNELDGQPFNWGKFMVARFTDEEWARRSQEPVAGTVNRPLLDLIGWSRRHVIVFDLQTCEGVAVRPGGWPKADLDKHKIWVCPLFEPFLEWLYKQDLSNLLTLPDHVHLPDAPSDMKGYRRPGSSEGISYGG